MTARGDKGRGGEGGGAPPSLLDDLWQQMREEEAAIPWPAPPDTMAEFFLLMRRSDGSGSWTPEQRNVIRRILRLSPFVRPMGRLLVHLRQAAKDPIIAADAGTLELVKALARMATLAGFREGPEYILKRLRALGPSRASRVAREGGKETREIVEAAWRALERKGAPVRGRTKAIAAATQLPLSTVRDALIASGVHTPKKRNG